MSVQFHYLNHLDDATPISASSEQTSFPASNVLEPFRSKVWRSGIGQISNQYIEFDCGYQIRPTCLIIVNEQRGILLSKNAVITLKGCNDGNWTTPSVNINIPWDEFLIMKQQSNPFGACRFWRIYFNDPDNTDNYIEIGYVFLGESASLTSSDVKFGWSETRLDDSDREESDGGEPWFDEKTQRDRWAFDLEYMDKTDKDNMIEMFKIVGKHKPFFLSLDPDLKISSSQVELTRFVRFIDNLEPINVFYNMYNIRISVEEAI